MHCRTCTDHFSVFADTEREATKETLKTFFESEVADEDIYICPQSLSPLIKRTRFYGLFKEKYWNVKDFPDLKYPITPLFNDMTIASEQSKPFLSLNSRERVGQRLFQNPILPFIYERGYRQNFERAGFPGIDKEFAEINEFFAENSANIVVDLSCGSGFMTRRLQKCGDYERVLGADLSADMLVQSRVKCIQEGVSPLPEFVRCDAAKLPFKSNSIDALHAGAAMHCWPRLSDTLMEINRVLKPGGKFYASTFLAQNLQGVAGARQWSNRGGSSTGFYIFKDEVEIEELLIDAGFVNGTDNLTGIVNVRREGQGCAIIKCTKPLS